MKQFSISMMDKVLNRLEFEKNYILNQIILAAVALDYLYMPQRRQEEKHPSLILSTQAVRIRKEENMSSLWYKEPAKVWEEALLRAVNGVYADIIKE